MRKPGMAKRDYYEVLGVRRTATADEIRLAHRRLVRQYHPDVNKDNKQAEEKFKEVQEAYDVLSDATRRQTYDQFGHAGAGPGGAAGPVDPFEAFRRSQGGRGGRRAPGGGRVRVEDFGFGSPGGGGGGGPGGGAGFEDVFEQIFGQQRGGAAGRRSTPDVAPPPNDVEYPVTITFYQAARGTNLPLQINREGRLETIEVKIPAGVKDGSRVRIKGRGQESNGRHGDLYIITKVTPHEHLRREGDDVYLEVPISMYEALLGTKLDVPTLDGPVQLTIPPGTGSHAKLRIKERGIHRGTAKGDQYCVIRVAVPREIDSADREMMADMRDKYPLNPRADLKWRE